MKLNAKDILKPTAILFIICVVVSAALGGTNLLTEDKIAEQAALKAEESRKLVLPGVESFEEVELPADWEGSPVYKGTANGTTVGYVLETSAKGYGGDVEIVTGISAAGEITGVEILSHSETPGLGANAEKEEFRDQYKQAVPDDGIQVVKYQTPAEGQIEAMTGATITSTAVTNAVNQAVEQYHKLQDMGSLGGMPSDTEKEGE